MFLECVLALQDNHFNSYEMNRYLDTTTSWKGGGWRKAVEEVTLLQSIYTTGLVVLPPSCAMDKTKLETCRMWKKLCMLMYFSRRPSHSLCMNCLKKAEILMFLYIYCFSHVTVCRCNTLPVKLSYHIKVSALRTGTWKPEVNTTVKINPNFLWCIYWYNKPPSNRVAYSKMLTAVERFYIFSCIALLWKNFGLN